MMGTVKVQLTGERATMLATLYGRALQSRSADPILKDELAEQIVARVDYDFSKLHIGMGDARGLAARGLWFDHLTAELVATMPEASVLHLGCGFDTRAWRIELPETVEWYDVDFPDVIELRRQLFPAREHYHLVGTSVTDAEWLDAIPADKPVIVVAEGLFVYVDEQAAIRFLRRLSEGFPSGQLVFDTLSKVALVLNGMMPMIRATGAKLRWGIDDPYDLPKWVPKLHLVAELGYDQMPTSEDLLDGVGAQVGMWLVKHVGPVRRFSRVLRFRF